MYGLFHHTASACLDLWCVDTCVNASLIAKKKPQKQTATDLTMVLWSVDAFKLLLFLLTKDEHFKPPMLFTTGLTQSLG